MKVAYVQLAPLFGNPTETLNRIEKLRSEFCTADLVVLPELCNSGYRFDGPAQARDLAEPVQNSPFINALTRVAQEDNLILVSGFNELVDDTLHNSAVVIGPNGHLGTYRKLHLFMDEKDIFAPGNLGLPVFSAGDIKFGVQICFDWIFPEPWRILALLGCDIIVHPANLVIPGKAQRAIPVHAMLNRIFIITANRIGTEKDLTFTGQSIIADPNGQILAQAESDKSEVAVVDIDPALARDKHATPRNNIFKDRRSDVYHQFRFDQS